LRKKIKRKNGQKLNHNEHDIRNKMHSEIDSQPWAFKETAPKGRKKMRNKENSTFWAMGTKHALVPRGQNRGINSSPGP